MSLLQVRLCTGARNGGSSFLPRSLVRAMVWSHMTPRLRLAGLTGRRSKILCLMPSFMCIT